MGFGDRGGFSDRVERGGYAIREPLDLPTEPPFTCHVGNLSFDATADDISDLFSGCGVTNVRIVEDKMTKAPKGFGYVEFETVEGLQKALDLSGTSLQGRTIRTSVAEPPKESRFEARDVDWTRRGPLPGPPERRVPERSSFGRNMDAASDAGSDRGGRRSNFESDGKFRDFGNWERKGPLSPSAGPAREGGRPRDNDGPGSSGFRRASPAWGEGRSQDEGSRPPRPERAPPAPTAADMDNQWRARMRPDQANETPSADPATTPATRPKLNLAKRTVADAPTGAASGGDSKASPFGAARPIDTATREREVEQKRQLAIRQKKESDEKVKTEKAEKAKVKTPGTDSNKDGVDTPQGAKNFEILRRAGGEESMPADEEAAEKTPAAAPAAEEAPKESANGNWRAAEAAAPAPTEEDDGWSTVGAPKQRNNRRGQAGRA
jgi:translation initiation factor 4B